MGFLYKDIEYEVEIRRKNNKNTYVRVRDGKIVVTTNYFVTKGQVRKLLEGNRHSIEKMIDRSNKREKNKELFLLFGECYDVIYDDFDKQITVEDGRICVVSQEVFMKWLDEYIHTTFYAHLMYWYSKFEGSIPIPNLKIRKMKSRWGVCNTRNHNVTLNLELFRYDISCLDYVIVHELAHFLVHNHSKEFWKVVSKYCPNYKEIRKKLRD